VLVDFWTYTCINWLRTLPYLRAWHERYRDQGLVLIGVHTPEFPFERDPGNVRRAVRDMQITYPVALDSSYAVWREFDNHYWPALYLVDADGGIRLRHAGEGEYADTELMLRQLLTESGARLGGEAGIGTGSSLASGPGDLVTIDGRGVEAGADWGNLRSPENYLGHLRTRNLATASGPTWDEPAVYPPPDGLALNQWAPTGEWALTPQAAALTKPDGRITCRFHARDLHLVMGPGRAGGPVRFRISLDGRAPGPAHGEDVAEDGTGVITEPRLYQLIRQPQPVTDRRFDIQFLDPGVEAYAFTFG
jgi:thiol-disulfide isomerase/thioredoxin